MEITNLLIKGIRVPAKKNRAYGGRMRRDIRRLKLLVVENILRIFETIVVACGPVVVLRLAIGIGNASADNGKLYACAGKIGVGLLKLIYPGITKALRLEIPDCRLLSNSDIDQQL
jgi:hypothetical protein